MGSFDLVSDGSIKQGEALFYTAGLSSIVR